MLNSRIDAGRYPVLFACEMPPASRCLQLQEDNRLSTAISSYSLNQTKGHRVDPHGLITSLLVRSHQNSPTYGFSGKPQLAQPPQKVSHPKQAAYLSYTFILFRKHSVGQWLRTGDTIIVIVVPGKVSGRTSSSSS